MADFWEQFADAPITQNNKSDNFWEQFDNPTPSRDLGKWGVETELRQAPKRNLLTDFKDCLNWVGNTTMAAYQEGKNQTETAHLEMRDMVGVITDTQKERLNTLNNTPQHDYQLNEKKYIDENETNFIPRTAVGIKKGYVEAVKMLPIIWETIKAGGVGYAVGAGAGATVGTGIGLATTKANTPQLALQGAKVGGAWGGRITGAMKIAEIEGGLARNELKQINEEIKEKGGEPLDKLEIDALALSVGAVNAGLEMVSLKQLLKTVPGGDAILESLEKKSLRELAMDKTVREQLHGVLAQYSKAIAAEVSTEMLQETTNIVAEHYAQKLGKVECTPLEKNVARVIDTGKATFGATMFLGGFTSAAKATTILAKQGMTKTEAEQAVANMTPEEINEVIENNIDTLFKSVEDIPTVKEQEDKTKLRDAYFEQIKNTGMEETEALNNATLMSEAFAALAKNTGVNLDDIEKEANIVIQNMSDEQAQQQYETDNSAAKSDITFNNETKENLIENELGRLYEEFSSLPEDYADENDILNRISNMQILEDLQNGLVSEENIQAIQNIISEYEKTNPELATFLKDAAERVGNILGLKEVEFQKIEQPKYQKIETAGAENNETALARQEWKKKGTESRFFKKFADNAQIVELDNAKGYDYKTGDKIVVELLHGTPRGGFEIFDKEKSGEANYNTSKLGFWFGDNMSLAENFANNTWWGDNPQIYRVFVKFNNPKVYDVQDYEKNAKQIENKIQKIQNKLLQGVKPFINDFYVSFLDKDTVQQDILNSLEDVNKSIDIFEKYKEVNGKTSTLENILSNYQVENSLKKFDQLDKNKHEDFIKFVIKNKKQFDKIDELKDELNYLPDDSFDELLNDMDKFNTNKKHGLREHFGANSEDIEKFKQSLISQGYDGIIIKNTRTDAEETDSAKVNQYVVFNNTQIKSVDNQGTFDESNPNIYYQKTDAEFEEQMNRIRYGKITDVNDSGAKFDDKLWLSPEQIENQGYDFSKFENRIGEVITLDFNRPMVKDLKFEKLAKERPQEKPNFNNQPINLEIESIAKKHFGTTSNYKVAGYILNDGSMLDFSGAKFGGNPNIRSIDHREINDAFLENEKYEDIGFDEFIDNGAIRFMPESNSILISRMPSDKQFERLKDVIIQANGEVSIEMVQGTANWGNSQKSFQKDYEQFSNPDKILADVRTYFNGGKISPLKTYFQSAYHGTPHRFDEFSTENIGTGEGAQAHGWGLYFAADKQVSENYRKSLSGDDFDNEKYFYNGKEITDRTKKAILSTIVQYGKDEVIARREFYIDNYAFNEKEKNKKNEELKYVKSLDESKIEKKTDKGQLFEVDVPENDVLLDEDKKFSEQTQYVQEAILKLFNETDIDKQSIEEDIERLEVDIEELKNTDDTNIDYIEEQIEEKEKQLKQLKLQLGIKDIKKHNYTGKGIYRTLSSIYGTDKAASDKLNEYGIKGITYDGMQDGRCYVVFDDKAINVLQTYYQGIDDDVNSNISGARGFTYQRKNFDGTEKENLIVLLNKKADKSTLMHEFAHVYLITLNNLAQHNDRAKELLMTVNQWLHYDGVEYTEFQHERFANNFVAYVKSGRAPSYGLKKVFENFRRWLNDMYSDLQESEDVFIDPETAKVFDELLGNITINAQKAEAEQIVNKANTNAKLRYANELDAQKKKVKINQLTEYQKRYRDTAYDILWYALNNSKKDGKPLIKDKRQLYMLFGQSAELTKKNKGVIKQAEKLAEFLAELDDVFSAGDGMLPEWREFFTDTITEDSDDASLALAALDVIMDRDYENAYPYEYDEHGNLSEGDITETNYALDVLIEEYKNADDKTIPLLAYNEWFKHVHFYIHEDIQKKWETATNEIDRYEALDNFEKAKEDLKLYAATLKGYGDYSTQFAEYARKIVKRLDFMTESDKGKLFDKLKEFNSFRDIERNLDDVMDYAKTLADVSDRRALAEQIDKEVRQTIHTWQNGIKKTKYTYPANKLFERLREINKMSSSTVQDMYDAYLNEEETPDYTDDTVHEKEYYSLIEELFVKYKINGIYYSSTEFLQDLLQRLQNAKYTAKIARDEIDFERRMKRLNKVDECAKALNERKSEIEENPVIKKAGKVNAAGFNFNGALKMIFNDSIKDWASLDYLYAKRDAQVGKDRKEFLEKAKKIFGYSGKFGDVKLFNRFIDMTQKYYTITQRHSPDIEQGSYRITSQMPETGFNATQYTQQIRQDMEFAEEWKPMQVELSKMEVLYYYIQAKNPTSYVILTDKDKGQFDKYDFDTMLDSLTEQEKLLGDVMQLAAEKYWNALNAYHVKKYHTDLGKVKGYFPRLSDTQDVKMLDMFNDYVAQTSNGKFQKQRTAGPGIRIKSANALAVLFDHIEKANTVITMGEHLDDINAVFSNPDLKKLMENIWGEDITKEFYGQLTGNLFTGQTLTKSLQEKWYGSIIGNLIKTNLFLKPQIGIKQLISFMNYGKGDEYVSPEEWWSRFIKQTLTPSEWKKNIDFMMENDYLRDRFYRGGSMDALKKELDTRFFSKLSLLDEFWSKPIQLGDIGAIILGGKPYIDALMDKGYTKEQAFRIFIETTVNDQQSSIPSTLSNMQRNSNKNPLAKMAFAYQNTPWQYYRQCTNAIMKALQSKEKPDIKRASKMLVLYGWLFPALFNMASSLSLLTFMSGGGDDDLLKDINPLRTITSVLTQHPILGEWIKGILNASEGKQYYSNDLISKHVKSINKLIRDFKKDKLTLKDFWDCLIAFAESAGAPLGSLSNAASGVFDIIQGDVMKGTIKTLGYSDYRAKVVTGEE